jgi:hypothetical protein
MQSIGKDLTIQEVKEMFGYITKSNAIGLKNFLEDRPNLDLMQITEDEKGFSTIH